MSEVLKARNQQVLIVAQQYLAQHQRFAFSAITLYEILRGLRASQATRGLNTFLNLVGNSDVMPVSLPVLYRAADLWADAGKGAIREMMPISSLPRRLWRAVAFS